MIVAEGNDKELGKAVGFCRVEGSLSGDIPKFMIMFISSKYRTILESLGPSQMPCAPMSKVCAGKHTKAKMLYRVLYRNLFFVVRL